MIQAREGTRRRSEKETKETMMVAGSRVRGKENKRKRTAVVETALSNLRFPLHVGVQSPMQPCTICCCIYIPCTPTTRARREHLRSMVPSIVHSIQSSHGRHRVYHEGCIHMQRHALFLHRRTLLLNELIGVFPPLPRLLLSPFRTLTLLLLNGRSCSHRLSCSESLLRLISSLL